MKKYLHFNQDGLKIIALITMTLDHMGKIIFLPTCEPMTLIGRTAFPIFSYLIMLHLYEKKCFQKYFVRLFLFGTLTSVVLVLQNESPNNILWTFFVAIACICLLGKAFLVFEKTAIRNFLNILIFTFCFFVSFGTDYSIFGFCYLLSLYGFFKYKSPLFVMFALVFGGLINPTTLSAAAISIITTGILLMNNPMGRNKRYIRSKWLFYVYYPAHLTLLYALRTAGIVF